MKTCTSVRAPIAGVIAVAAMLSLGSCGGGGGGGGSTMTTPLSNPPPATQGTIAGTAIKGPVSGATVTAYAVTAGTMGAQIGSATTDAQGNFNIPIGTYTGPVMLQLAGGTYTDEATGVAMPMMSGDVMTAVMQTVAAGASVGGIQLTALTSMAQTMAAHMTGGMTDANISTANSNVGTYFAVSDILHTMPMNPLVSGSGSASQDAINYGMTLAAMSQYATSKGMSSSSAIVTAMMNDAADGVLDGKTFGTPVMMGGMAMGTAMPSTAGTSGLATQMLAFLSSAQNKSGVGSATMQTLINELNSSGGQMMGTAGTGSAANGTLSGMVFDGPMSQGMVTAYAIANGTKGGVLASTALGGQGAFSMSVGSYSGPVMLQVTGGAYLDEATGSTMTMGSSDVMTAVLATVPSGATTSGISLTPLSSMAQAFAQGMAGGMTDANINTANTGVGSYFMVSDILHTPPMDPRVAGSGSGATQDQRNCGFAIAAMSEYAKDNGVAASSAFVTAMMSDASDGMMNGKSGSTQISMGGMMMGSGNMMQPTAGTSGLATSMTTFVGSSANMSGLTATDMNALIQQLAASNGHL